MSPQTAPTATAEISGQSLADDSAALHELARDNFYAYRVLMNPGMKTNWWTDEVSKHLQEFYADLIEGKRPKLALMAPPQHGKSKAVNDFTGWVAGKAPQLKTIFASYSDELGIRANTDLRRAIRDSETYHRVWPHMQVDVPGWVCKL